MFVLAALFGGFMFFLVMMKEFLHLLWGIVRGKLVWIEDSKDLESHCNTPENK